MQSGSDNDERSELKSTAGGTGRPTGPADTDQGPERLLQRLAVVREPSPDTDTHRCGDMA